ncbi:hypothetical protein QQP08_006670 [Theobroma cacao]|nr:hypothetical protein QQP08_006670 [Theobroma cacao]
MFPDRTSFRFGLVCTVQHLSQENGKLSIFSTSLTCVLLEVAPGLRLYKPCRRPLTFSVAGFALEGS